MRESISHVVLALVISSTTRSEGFDADKRVREDFDDYRVRNHLDSFVNSKHLLDYYR